MSEIESGIARPPKKFGKPSLPVRQMVVGQSIVVKCLHHRPSEFRLSAKLAGYRKRGAGSFSYRRISETECRVWRVE